MATPSIDPTGFTEVKQPQPTPRRYAAALELVAGIALVVSTVVAMTVVSIGIARADTLVHWRADDGPFAVAAWTELTLIGLSALSGAIAWIVPWASRAMRRI